MDNSMGIVELEVTRHLEPMGTHADPLCLECLHPKDVGRISRFAEFRDKEMLTVPLKPH
jgi:hypothetical protein